MPKYFRHSFLRIGHLGICVAERVWVVQREQVACAGSHQVHREPGAAPQKMTFEEEFIAFLKKHGVEYDPKYVFG